MNIAQALAQARARGVARLDAQLLLARTLQRPRSWLVAHDDAALSPHSSAPLPPTAGAAPAATRWPMCWVNASSMA